MKIGRRSFKSGLFDVVWDICVSLSLSLVLSPSQAARLVPSGLQRKQAPNDAVTEGKSRHRSAQVANAPWGKRTETVRAQYVEISILE